MIYGELQGILSTGNEDVGASEPAPEGYDVICTAIDTLIHHFGKRTLSEIKQADINNFLTELIQRGASFSKVTKCKAMLIQIFTAAEVNELIHHNPAQHAKIIRQFETGFMEEEMISEKKDAFAKEEIALLKGYLPDNLTGNSILLMLGTGLRVQELLALKQADIAEDGSTVNVSKAIKMVGGVPQLGPPKSKRSRRTIPVPEEYRKNALYLRNHGGSAFIWTSEREDGLYAVKVFRSKYYKTLKLVPGVRPLTPHCCRHTYITQLQAKGVSIELIARLAGHSKIITTDGYTHTSIETLANAVEKL